MLPDWAGLVAALNSGDVRFVVIGAVAVGAHCYIRATQDLDIVPEPKHENLDRLGNGEVRLDARLSADQRPQIDREIRHALYAGRSLTLTTKLGDLDVVQRLPGIPSWRALESTAETTSLGGEPLIVCSREHPVAMKRAGHSLQDQADLEALEADRELRRSRVVRSTTRTLCSKRRHTTGEAIRGRADVANNFQASAGAGVSGCRRHS
jgi:hypothetical protein